MTIQLISNRTDAEGFTANRFLEYATDWLPGHADSTDLSGVIASGVKLFGYRVQDIDTVCFLAPRVAPVLNLLRPVPIRGEAGEVTNSVRLSSLLLAIEVKSHDPRGVRFEANQCFVRYSRGGIETWHNATEQSISQAHSLKQYLSDSGLNRVFVANFIFFPNLGEIDLPQGRNNFLSASMSSRRIFTKICEMVSPSRFGDHSYLNCCRKDDIQKLFDVQIFRKSTPTALDRAKIDRISAGSDELSSLVTLLGKGLVILRGRGGAGKTITLLQLAYQSYQESGSRFLFLTYNRVLAADVRRLLYFMGLSGALECGGIKVETVMHFMYRVGRFAGLDATDESLEARYDSLLGELKELFCNSNFSRNDLVELLADHADDLLFDYILIDEGQDWLAQEIDVLCSCYGASRLIVADGVDQLIRGPRARWTKNLLPGQFHTVELKKSLRLKSNLTDFANNFSERIGLSDWAIERNQHVLGGRVMVCVGELEDHKDLLHGVMEDQQRLGNEVVDMMFLGKSSVTSFNGVERSELSCRVERLGFEFWDGILRSTRDDFVTSDKVRVLRYESARGLEGWTIICVELDLYFDIRVKQLQRSRDGLSEISARKEVSSFLMMLFTRPIDTLIINVNSADSYLTSILRSLHLKNPDVIDWLEAVQ